MANSLYNYASGESLNNYKAIFNLNAWTYSNQRNASKSNHNIYGIENRNNFLIDNLKEARHVHIHLELDLERLIHKDLQVHSKQKLFLTAVAACDL